MTASIGPREARGEGAVAFERWTGVGGMADDMRQAGAPLLADAMGRG